MRREPKQLTYEGKGNAANVYGNQKANRAVIIKNKAGPYWEGEWNLPP